MVGIERKDTYDQELASGGAGDIEPPQTNVGMPEFGDFDRWQRERDRWQFEQIVGEVEVDELEIAASIARHPASNGATQIELTQALLNDGWRQRHEQMKEGLQRMRLLDGNVVYLDYFRVPSPFEKFPPSSIA